MYIISRRKFIKSGLVIVGGAMAVSSLGITLANAPRFSLLAGIAQIFGTFILNTASGVVASLVSDSLKSRIESATEQVLEPAGFTDTSYGALQSNHIDNMNGDVHFWLVGNEDRVNVCVPFLTRYADVFVEAPAILGLSWAAEDWYGERSTYGLSSAEGLIPLNTLQSAPSRLEESYPQYDANNRKINGEFQYSTKAGLLRMGYTADAGRNQGIISLVSEDNNGGTLFGRDYKFNWA